MKKKHVFLFLIWTVLYALHGSGQNHSSLNNLLYEINLPELSADDKLFLNSVPVIKANINFAKQELPEKVDNSLQPFFRPIFNQASMECGQASAVGYGFTYEIDRLRDISADVPKNQYPTHFVYNFSNGGSSGAANFVDSWNIVRCAGTPNVEEYGGMANGGTARWMNGYDLYYSAMKNRLSNVYGIPVGTPEGIETLRQWIDNHLDGSETGGVGNFYCSYTSASQTLPPGTPEAGKYVIVNWSSYYNHALCVVGYHDSIRYDFNNDGQYTNHLDINNDGIVDVRDWEIGGLKLANSYYATSWGNNGFAYMMYQALGEPYNSGGIYNQMVYVHYARENTEPQLTYKVTLTHNKRNQIKVMAGVSTDPAATAPDYILEFPIINYQGGEKYMQGGSSAADKTLEFGLDVTPLLNFIEPGQNARFFMMVNEKDDSGTGTGEIVSFSVMDYTNGITEIPCPQTNVALVNNGLTLIGVETAINYNVVSITTPQLPQANLNEPYSLQLEAEGGTPPYHWDIKRNYQIDQSTDIFPNVSAQSLNPYNTDNGWAMKELPFDFPFYGKYYNKIYVHVDGNVLFRGDHTPWTFVVDELNMFKNFCNISVYGAKPLVMSSGDGMWYEGSPSEATIRWRASVSGSTGSTEINFALKLFPDGTFEMYYGDIQSVPWLYWLSGISDGTMEDFQLTALSNTHNITSGTKIRFIPDYDLTEFSLTDGGLFSGTPTYPYEAKSVSFKVTDNNGISDIKEFFFSTVGVNGLVIREVAVQAGDDDIIEYGEEVVLGVTLENIGTLDYNDVSIEIHSDDPLITLIDSVQNLGNITSGQMLAFDNIFEFTVSDQIPNGYPIHFNTSITTSSEVFNTEINLTGFAPDIVYSDYVLDDGNNGFLEPGETAEIIVAVFNQGGADASDVNLQISTADPFMSVVSGSAGIAFLESYGTAEVTFTISCSASTPLNYFAEFEVLIDFGGINPNTGLFIVPVGVSSENFESGTFNGMDWQFGGNAPWTITQDQAYEGEFSMRSGVIGHNSSSSVFLTAEVVASGTISFWYKVSSESGYDFLTFYIDDALQGEWSGEVPWTQAEYNVISGSHTFKWVYDKDMSVANGSDCGWVDMIVFPPLLNETVTVYAGADAEVCEGTTLQLNGSAVNAVSYLWATSGDGTFNNATIPDPMYTPGQQDIVNGSAELTFTGTGQQGTSVSDAMLLTIYPLPEVTLNNLPDLCLDDVPYLLEEGFPSGGTYSGAGVENGYFYPGITGVGSFEIIYTYLDEHGCMNSDTGTLVVMYG